MHPVARLFRSQFEIQTFPIRLVRYLALLNLAFLIMPAIALSGSECLVVLMAPPPLEGGLVEKSDWMARFRLDGGFWAFFCLVFSARNVHGTRGYGAGVCR